MKKIDKSVSGNIKTITFVAALCLSLALHTGPACLAQQIIQSSQSFTDMANHDHQPCITKEIREKMEARTRTNINRLTSQGVITGSQQKSTVVTETFAWPLTYNSNFYDNEYYYIQNYIDHDPSTGNLIDYTCGDRTYDKPNGYDHSGTDICIGPYYWSMMDSMFVHVIAAAPGIIVDKDDGNYDRNCGFGAGNPNYVKIMHNDGSFAIYYHMKSGSVTDKANGEYVEEGEYLGIVGSSGSSTNPHLHFEVLDQNGDVVDPWVGACNPDISTSLWKNQLPYYNPGILRIMTLTAPVPSSTCPDPEPLTMCNHFNSLQPVRIEIHLRDVVPALVIGMTITDPAGNPFSTNFTNNGSFTSSGFYYSTYIPSASGTYKISVTYSGQSAVHYFTVGCPGAYNLSGSHSGKKGYLTGSNITSTANISSASSNQIWYEAESYIQVNPGFRATSGCTFTARINNCTVGGVRNGEITGQPVSSGSSLSAVPAIANNESKLVLNLSTDDKITITVYDQTGRMTETLVNEKSFVSGNHDLLFQTGSYPSGLYLIKLTGRQTEKSCRILIQH